MRVCSKCNIKIGSDLDECPLCENPLDLSIKVNDVFPLVKTKYYKHDLFKKCLLLLSSFGGITSLYVNYLVNGEISWAYIVLFALLVFWITLSIGLRRSKNFLKTLFTELNIILVGAIIIDYYTGFNSWSITYVLPFICISYIVMVFLIMIFRRGSLKGHIFYTYINCLIGLIPLIFIIRDTITVTWPSSICVLLSIFLMLMVFIFDRRKVTDELERRLHF